MGARDLKLQVVLAAIDKATSPIKSIMQGSIGLARTLKSTRDTLKGLQAQQSNISSFKTLKGATEQTSQAMQANRDKLKQLSQQLANTANPTKALSAEFQRAVRQGHALKQKHGEQQRELQGLRGKLNAAGISTRNLGQHERDLKAKISATNASISEQGKRLQRLTVQHKRLAMAKSQYQKTQALAGSMAGSGAAGLASGYAIAAPLKGVIDAFAPAENASTQLKVSMMGSDGSVAADFQKISDLANSLGDRLPGTTADFQEMMTMLKRQGLSSANILGGTGEAAAYLGVQLQMPVTAAAEFAAKMQDATRTSEKDMLGLMDTIQRTYYLGVDSGNMLQGFSKISPVMGVIKKQGLEAANTLAPLLVMMDQTGMAGESAGNALRKVFQSGLNMDKVSKANKELKSLGISMDFTDGKGEFGGMDKLFAQLEKLKGLSAVKRTSVMKTVFGDDAETLTTVETMMNKGMAGYQEIVAKMQAQADLRKRVNEQLSTLSNTMEAAQGSWSNAMAEVGAAIAPELKEFISALGEIAVKVKGWVKENPQLTAQIVKTAAGLALLLAAGGAIALTLASILGPIAMVRYGMALLTIKGGGLLGMLWSLGKTALPLVAKGILFIGRALMMNPIGLAITAIAAAAFLIYTYWEPIKAFFGGLWAEIKAAFAGGIGGVAALLINWSPLGLFYKAFAGVMSYFGVELPGKFSEFGGMLISGLVSGITNAMGSVKTAITGAGESTIGWFKDKLGIRSPSRVFAELGGFTMAGLTQGLAGGEDGPLSQLGGFAKRMTQAGALALGVGAGAMPALAGGEPLSIDNRPPLSASAGAGVSIGGDTYHITIQAAPGGNASDLAQQISRMLDERERSKAARIRSRLHDQE